MAEELSWVRWVTAFFVLAVAMGASFLALRKIQVSNKINVIVNDNKQEK